MPFLPDTVHSASAHVLPCSYYKMPADMPEPSQWPAVQADLYMDSGV